jgi:hypothetical protein
MRRASFCSCLAAGLLLVTWPEQGRSAEAWETWDWMGKSEPEKRAIVHSETQELISKSRLKIQEPGDIENLPEDAVPKTLMFWCPNQTLRMRSRAGKAKWFGTREGYTLDWWRHYSPWDPFPDKRFDPDDLLARLEKASTEIPGYQFVQSIKTSEGGAGLIEWKTAEYDNALYWFRHLRSLRSEPVGTSYVELRFYAAKRHQYLSTAKKRNSVKVVPAGTQAPVRR